MLDILGAGIYLRNFLNQSFYKSLDAILGTKQMIKFVRGMTNLSYVLTLCK